MKLYLIGSLRNPAVPHLAEKIRQATGFEVFDDWFAAGPEADDKWRDYERARGHDMTEALAGYAANHVFEYDKHHIDTSECGVVVLPAGKSGHIEAGYMLGRGKPVFLLYAEEPERFDVMYKFFTGIFTDLDALIARLQRLEQRATLVPYHEPTVEEWLEDVEDVRRERLRTISP